ncbi:nuclear transport factor 2 family protein [Brevibacterium oceani]|uniref:nuclear transport factor 2 family protein n=1 Tax=Brevibacterium oceani TaxID=358099 RepID=UPI001B32C7A4|nr:nuclear transport factor 2 family protein [Brevibacterium oceani]
MTVTSEHTVRAFLAGLSQKDTAAALSVVSDDVQLTVHPLRISQGDKTRVKWLLDEIVTAFPDLLITISTITDVGRVAVAEFKLEGTQAADFLGAINQEKHLDLDTAWRFTVDHDQIVGIDAYWCQNQLYRRLAVKRQDRVAIV